MVIPGQTSLFETPSPSTPSKSQESDAHDTKAADIKALDEMFAASQLYRSSESYQKMLKFMANLHQLAPFNAMLLYTQDPEVSYVATANDWLKKFKRRPLANARPLVILWPFAPVVFVYDLRHTEGEPVPEEALRPFKTEGRLDADVWHRLIMNAWKHGIAIRERPLAHQHAGSALRLTQPFQDEYCRILADQNDPNALPADQRTAKYLIILKQDMTREDQFTTLAHELAHIFCGHVGRMPDDWWDARRGLGHAVEEIEAESIAYLASQRQGLTATSHQYLSNFNTENEFPAISLEAVCTVTGYLESMCRPGFKPKSPPKQAPKSSPPGT